MIGASTMPGESRLPPVLADLGAAFVARHSLGGDGQPYVRLEGVDVRRPVAACWRHDRAPSGAARALLTLLEKRAAE